jgi:hypothetical protein
LVYRHAPENPDCGGQRGVAAGFPAVRGAFPESFIARLIGRERFIETEARDVPEDFLYPSQSWASLNTGLPYSTHQIHWYNDKKVFSNFYWHAIAHAGHPTVIVNTLHSSPLVEYQAEGNYKFVIPDCFSSDAATTATFRSERLIDRDVPPAPVPRWHAGIGGV